MTAEPQPDDLTSAAAERLATFVSEQFAAVFSVLEKVSPSVIRLVESFYDRERPLVADDLRSLEPVFTTALQECDRTVKGLSFSSERGVIAGRPYTVAYWIRRPDGGIVESFPLTDPKLEEHYEYHDFDFFVGARSGADRTVSGPYVDYGYDNQYRLTFAVRVATYRGFVGAVTADIFLDRLESRLLAIAREARGAIVLANEDDRIVVSNRASLPTGLLLAQQLDWRVVDRAAEGWKVLWRPAD